MINYRVDTKGIYHIDFINTVTYKDIVHWLAEFSEITPISQNLYLVYNLCNADLKINPRKLVKISHLAEEATRNYVKVRTAFVMTHGLFKAYVFLFSFLNSGNKAIRKAFSEQEKAYGWITSCQSEDLAYG